MEYPYHCQVRCWHQWIRLPRIFRSTSTDCSHASLIYRRWILCYKPWNPPSRRTLLRGSTYSYAMTLWEAFLHHHTQGLIGFFNIETSLSLLTQMIGNRLLRWINLRKRFPILTPQCLIHNPYSLEYYKQLNHQLTFHNNHRKSLHLFCSKLHELQDRRLTPV